MRQLTKEASRRSWRPRGLRRLSRFRFRRRHDSKRGSGAVSASSALLAHLLRCPLGSGLHDQDLNARRHERRIMRNVVLVAEEELQGVRSRLKRNLRLGLAGTEVEMIEVVGNGPIERRQLGVDQQVVMTRILDRKSTRLNSS